MPVAASGSTISRCSWAGSRASRRPSPTHTGGSKPTSTGYSRASRSTGTVGSGAGGRRASRSTPPRARSASRPTTGGRRRARPSTARVACSRPRPRRRGRASGQPLLPAPARRALAAAGLAAMALRVGDAVGQLAVHLGPAPRGSVAAMAAALRAAVTAAARRQTVVSVGPRGAPVLRLGGVPAVRRAAARLGEDHRGRAGADEQRGQEYCEVALHFGSFLCAAVAVAGASISANLRRRATDGTFFRPARILV